MYRTFHSHAPAWLGLLALLWFFAGSGLLALWREDYGIATKAISELGAIGAPGMLAMNLGVFLGTGLLLALFVRSIGPAPYLTRPVRLGLYATAVLFALTAIPIEMTADGQPDMASRLTQLHLIPVLAAPLPWLWAITRLGFRTHVAVPPTLRWVCLAFLAAFILVGIVRFGGLFPDTPGLLQRATIAVFLGWYPAAGLAIAGAPWSRNLPRTTEPSAAIDTQT